MPWQTSTLETQRRELVTLALSVGANRSELAARAGISRKTLYKWIAVSASGGGLVDRSRRPLRNPNRSSAEVEAAVLAWRDKHPRWGGRKIARLLEKAGVRVCPSTVTEILRRNDRLDGPRAGESRGYVRYQREHPNELWQMDFKGHFPILVGVRCHPFGCLDDRTRFCLALKACSDERSATVQSCLTNAFRTYGLPNSILCDNGGCWGASGIRDMTPLAVWISLQGVQVLHGRPYHPQTQGKEERFHRTLDLEAIQGRGFVDIADCQRAFDRFRNDYNIERPHEALGLETPASLYVCSPRPFREGSPPAPEYPAADIVQKVQAGGVLHFEGREFRVGKALRGQPVAVRPYEQDGQYEVVFGRSRVQIIDLRDDPKGATTSRNGKAPVAPLPTPSHF